MQPPGLGAFFAGSFLITFSLSSVVTGLLAVKHNIVTDDCLASLKTRRACEAYYAGILVIRFLKPHRNR